MSSFTLQLQEDAMPQKSVNTCYLLCFGLSAIADILPDESDLVWSFSRDEIPPYLTGRNVNLSVWQATHDKTTKLYKKHLAHAKNTFTTDHPCSRVPFLSCLVPCFTCSMFSMLFSTNEAVEMNQEWQRLVEEERPHYAAAGVYLLLSKQTVIRTSGDSNHTSSHQRIRGIQFDLLQASYAAVQPTLASATVLDVQSGAVKATTPIERSDKEIVVATPSAPPATYDGKSVHGG